MDLHVLIVPGDGIGTEVTREAVRVLPQLLELGAAQHSLDGVLHLALGSRRDRPGEEGSLGRQGIRDDRLRVEGRPRREVGSSP